MGSEVQVEQSCTGEVEIGGSQWGGGPCIVRYEQNKVTQGKNRGREFQVWGGDSNVSKVMVTWNHSYGQTNMTENMTFPQLRFRPVSIPIFVEHHELDVFVKQKFVVLIRSMKRKNILLWNHRDTCCVFTPIESVFFDAKGAAV